MARFGCFKNGWIEVNGVVLSDHCTEFGIEESAEELPDHAHGDEVSLITPGLFNWTIRATFLQDFAAASVHRTLRPLFINRTKHVIRVRPDSAAQSLTNPMYSGYAYLTTYQPVRGAHGQNLTTEAVFRPASALTEITA